MEEYKDEFISEARQHLDNLNEKLLLLEKSPDDSEVINSIFRSCHTLKGNAATMGYNKFSELAHDMENVLDQARNKKLKITSTILDTVLKACDILEEGLKQIGAGTPDGIEIADVIKNLNAITPNEYKSAENHKAPDTANLTDSDKKIIETFKSTGKDVFRLVVLIRDNPLKGMKGVIIVKTLKNMANIINIYPTEDLIKEGKFNEEIDFIVSTDKKRDDIKKELSGISKVSEVHVLELNESLKDKKSEEKVQQIIQTASNPQVQTSQTPVSSIQSSALQPFSTSSAQIQTGKPLDSKDYVKQVQEIRIDVKKLDNLQNMVGELLINKMRIEEINSRYNIKELAVVLKTIDLLTSNIQSEVIDERMLPIDQTFNRFPRMVRDLARELNKKTEFIMTGGDNKLDRTVIDNIGDPLVHMIRNAIDHGIESPEDRKKAGKPETGMIKLSARREKSYVVIDLTDDGAGIDVEKLKQKSVQKGMITQEEANKMTKDQALNTIFRAGLSTNEVITKVSGRGVGMDVVLSKIKEVNGFVDIKSEFGKGSTVSLKLPLTMAIITVLLIKCANEIYAIPLSSIDQTVDIASTDIRTVQGEEVMILRGKEIALMRLHNLIGIDKKDKNEYVVVIVERQGERIGLIVDEIIGQQQVLIKSVNDRIKKIKGLAGATILGDGRVCFILDMVSLI